MSNANPAALKAFLDECHNVINSEATLLGKWATNAAIPIDRQQQLAISQREITTGFSSPKGTITALLGRFASLNATHLVAEPNNLHKKMLADLRTRFDNRKAWDIAAFGQNGFTLTLTWSVENAWGAASTADVVLADCVR